MSDIDFIKKADKVSIKRYKTHDKIILEFDPPSKLARTVWRLRGFVEDIPDDQKELRRAILDRLRK